MAFFTRSVLHTTSLPPEEQGDPAPSLKETRCALRLYVHPVTGKYAYAFDDLTFLLDHAEHRITFYLRNEIPNTTAKIVKHVHSGNPERETVTPVGPIKVGRIEADLVNGSTPPDRKNPYKDVTCKRVRFRLDLDDFDMIHIGLVIHILDEKDDKIVLGQLLCDPQVGNGPP